MKQQVYEEALKRIQKLAHQMRAQYYDPDDHIALLRKIQALADKALAK